MSLDPIILRASYIKTDGHRTIPVSGAIAQVAPNGTITLTPFIERSPVPQTVFLKIDNGIAKEDPTKTESKEGVIREFSVTIVLDRDGVNNLLKVLNGAAKFHDENFSSTNPQG